MNGDQILLGAARKQLAAVLASGNAMAFLGWWAVWKDQDGIRRDDLIDLVSEAGAAGMLP